MSVTFPDKFHATDPGEGCHDAELLVQEIDVTSSTGFQPPGAPRVLNTKLFMVDNCTDPEAVAASLGAHDKSRTR
jgi:hypothetical protein